MNLLPPEDPNEVSPLEAHFRKLLVSIYRLVWAVFVSWHVNDFLYSPLWMHGYVWCLNLPVDTRTAEISAGTLAIRQARTVGPTERLAHDCLKVFAVAFLLLCAGFYTRRQTVRRLWVLSCAAAAPLFFVRSLQMQHRLLPALHEAFCSQVAVFLIGLCLTIQPQDSQLDEPRQQLGQEPLDEDQCAMAAEPNNNDEKADNLHTLDDCGARAKSE